MLTSTNVNPFAEWNTHSSDSSPSVFGALPSIPIAPSLPVFISDSLVLRFSANNDVLNCVLLGPQNRTLFSTSTSGSRASFQNVENIVFAVVDFAPHATVEIQGFTPRQLVRDWLRLTPDQRYEPIFLNPGIPRLTYHDRQLQAVGSWKQCVFLETDGTPHCGEYRYLRTRKVWPDKTPQLMSQDNTILGRITRSANATTLEITRPAVVSNLLYPCIVSATLFLSGRHID